MQRSFSSAQPEALNQAQNAKWKPHTNTKWKPHTNTKRKPRNIDIPGVHFPDHSEDDVTPRHQRKHKPHRFDSTAGYPGEGPEEVRPHGQPFKAKTSGPCTDPPAECKFPHQHRFRKPKASGSGDGDAKPALKGAAKRVAEKYPKLITLVDCPNVGADCPILEHFHEVAIRGDGKRAAQIDKMFQWAEEEEPALDDELALLEDEPPNQPFEEAAAVLGRSEAEVMAGAEDPKPVEKVAVNLAMHQEETPENQQQPIKPVDVVPPQPEYEDLKEDDNMPLDVAQVHVAGAQAPAMDQAFRDEEPSPVPIRHLVEIEEVEDPEPPAPPRPPVPPPPGGAPPVPPQPDEPPAEVPVPPPCELFEATIYLGFGEVGVSEGNGMCARLARSLFGAREILQSSIADAPHQVLPGHLEQWKQACNRFATARRFSWPVIARLLGKTHVLPERGRDNTSLITSFYNNYELRTIHRGVATFACLHKKIRSRQHVLADGKFTNSSLTLIYDIVNSEFERLHVTDVTLMESTISYVVNHATMLGVLRLLSAPVSHRPVNERAGSRPTVLRALIAHA